MGGQPMSLLFRRPVKRDAASDLMLARGRMFQPGSVAAVNGDSALRHSAVWACLRLRADLISTLPVDVFRRVEGVQVEVPRPPLLVSTGGPRVPVTEWLYSSQVDLDRHGNCFGLIVERDGQGNPQRIDLMSAADVTVRVRDGELAGFLYRGQSYDPADVWHEKQWTIAGLHVGLSPVAYAAWSIATGLSAQEFALNWFKGGGVPTGHLKNNKLELTRAQAEAARDQFLASVQAGGPFTSGNDWDYTIGAGTEAADQFLDTQQSSVVDVCRYFSVPADLIDGTTPSNNITYANVTQRNLQLLVINLNPAIIRREVALSSALARPRYVKFNTDALLRMDPLSRVELINAQRESNTITNSEARELDNRQPMTPEQLAEIAYFAGLSRAASPVSGERSAGSPVTLNLPAVQMDVSTSTPDVVVNVPEPVVRNEVNVHPAVDVRSPDVVVNVPEPVVRNEVNVHPAAVAAPVIQVEPAPVKVVAPVTVNVPEPPDTRTKVKRDPSTGLVVETVTEKA